MVPTVLKRRSSLPDMSLISLGTTFKSYTFDVKEEDLFTCYLKSSKNALNYFKAKIRNGDVDKDSSKK